MIQKGFALVRLADEAVLRQYPLTADWVEIETPDPATGSVQRFWQRNDWRDKDYAVVPAYLDDEAVQPPDTAQTGISVAFDGEKVIGTPVFTPLGQDEIALRDRIAEREADVERSAFIDKLRNASDAQIEAYIKSKIDAASVTDLASARAFANRVEAALFIFAKALAGRL